MSTEGTRRIAIRMQQASVMDTWDPNTYDPAGMTIDGSDGGGSFGTMTREHYLAMHAKEAPMRFTNPRTKDGE